MMVLELTMLLLFIQKLINKTEDRSPKCFQLRTSVFHFPKTHPYLPKFGINYLFRGEAYDQVHPNLKLPTSDFQLRTSDFSTSILHQVLMKKNRLISQQFYLLEHLSMFFHYPEKQN